MNKMTYSTYKPFTSNGSVCLLLSNVLYPALRLSLLSTVISLPMN